MRMKRLGGILLHISSLPDEYGIGTIGKSARSFCDFLQKSGMRAWQMLPINPCGKGASPYDSPSLFAGNPMLIDLSELLRDGLLTESELDKCRELSLPDSINFGPLFTLRKNLLRLAFSRFSDYAALDKFEEREKSWLSDYASFMSIKDAFCIPKKYYIFEQFIFFSQWARLKEYAASRGISLIGDAPIYVAADSADVYANPALFNVDDALNASEMAGCPPDAFSRDGQLWGNPTYNWEEHAKGGYSWWISRLFHLSRLFDVIRLDHFRAFEAYWAIPQGAKSAAEGRWKEGPGKAFFDAVKKAFPSLFLIAEDLGFLTDSVFRLRDEFKIPGMRVLQFAFDGSRDNIYLPDNYIENCVAYTGTHDNDTTRGWAESSSPETLALARDFLGISHAEKMSDAFVRSIWRSRAFLAIAPMQDFLDLPSSARMNTPSTVSDKNWSFRIRRDSLSEDFAKKLLALNSEYGRI